MTADAVVSRELKSLQEELATAQRERSASQAAPPQAPAPEQTGSDAASADERQLRELLGKLVSEAGEYLEEAEAEIAAHPGRSVLAALIVGILIGRLLGRR